MSLPLILSLSNVHVISGSVSTDCFFSPHDSWYFFLLVCMPGHFSLDARHCEFYLLRCWIFFYSYESFLELCSEKQLNWFGNSSVLSTVLLSFARQDENGLHSERSCHSSEVVLFACSTWCPGNCKVLHFRMSPSVLPLSSFPTLRGWPVLNQRLLGTLCWSLELFPGWHSHYCHWTTQGHNVTASLDTWGPPGSPLSELSPQNSPGSRLRQPQCSPHLSPLSQELLSWVQCLKNTHFLYFPVFQNCFRKEKGKSSCCCHAIWAGSRSPIFETNCSFVFFFLTLISWDFLAVQ